MGLLSGLHRDAKLLMAARGIRAFAFSYLNVVFAIYLDRIGYSTLPVITTCNSMCRWRPGKRPSAPGSRYRRSKVRSK